MVELATVVKRNRGGMETDNRESKERQVTDAYSLSPFSEVVDFLEHKTRLSLNVVAFGLTVSIPLT